MELIVYPPSENPKLINNSPFCSKTEIFLRLNGIEHTVVPFNGNPGKFKNGKLPVLKDGETVICDSSLIQKYLENRLSLNMDAHLSDIEKSQGYAFAKLAEEFLYWSLLHERWFIDENWVRLRDGYFGHIPGIVRGFVTGIIRKSTKKSAIGHGMSRHRDEDIHRMGADAIGAISTFLGDKTYFLGGTLSSFDSTIYAFIASLRHSTLGPKLAKEVDAYDNLKAYDERMFQLINQK